MNGGGGRSSFDHLDMKKKCRKWYQILIYEYVKSVVTDKTNDNTDTIHYVSFIKDL